MWYTVPAGASGDMIEGEVSCVPHSTRTSTSTRFNINAESRPKSLNPNVMILQAILSSMVESNNVTAVVVCRSQQEISPRRQNMRQMHWQHGMPDVSWQKMGRKTINPFVVVGINS